MALRWARLLPILPLISSSSAFGAAFGLVTAEGDFKLNDALVRGNATLVDGSIVETLRAPSRLRLPGGATARLDAGTRARVLADRLVVESGSGELRSGAGYSMEARTLRVEADPGVQAWLRFALLPGGASAAVQLAAAKGRMQVRNAAGTLVSRLEPGLALAFEPQVASTAPAAPSSFLGCIVKKESKWMLYDPALRILVELRGMTASVEREWGNRVQVNGTTPASGQPQGRQIMDVTTISLVAEGGCAEAAQAVDGEVPAAKPAPPAQQQSASSPSSSTAPRTPRVPTPDTGGMSAGTRYAIIGAVAGGGIAGIAAAAGGDKRSR